MSKHVVVAAMSVVMLALGVVPARAQSRYVSFAQAGGFDTSRAWGYGFGADLNGAIYAAHVQCQANGAVCGEEGWCALQPGLFSAWASNRQVAGGRGVACNLPTKAQAEARALAECGTIHLGNAPPCEILWSGSGAASADRGDDLHEWVRANFMRVAGWAPDERTVADYVSQLQAWSTRAPMQQGKDYLLNEVFPSLRR